MINNLLRKILLTLTPLLWGGPAVAQDGVAVAPPSAATADAKAKVPDIDTLKKVPEKNTSKKDADPALWVLKDQDTTIYMFGTVHILKPGLSWFDSAVKDAFDRSDKLVLELVTPDAATSQKIFGKYAIDKSGKSLRDKLSADERTRYEKALSDLGFPANSFDALKPWAVGMTLQLVALSKDKFDVNSGVEQQLTSAAKASKKPIAGVETMQGQLKIFDDLSEAQQVKFLMETVDEMGSLAQNMDKMVDYWAAPDPDKLGELMNQGFDDPTLYDALLTRRNSAWARWINERMKKPGTVFMAVGAGHLAGPTSVQNLLSAYGLKAERVAY